MEHVAIDLGGRESQICVRAETGELVREVRWPTDDLERFLASRSPSVVIVETCAQAFAVADVATRLGHQVRVVPATLARVLGVGARKTKTDRRDARALSEASCRLTETLPAVHVPSETSRERKSLCTAREVLVGSRTKLINSARGWLRTQNRQLRRGGPASLTTRMREIAPPAAIERLLKVIDLMNAEIADADKELERIAEKDEICRRLMSVPGVGPVTAVRFVAALDDQERFESAHKVEAYLGLTPGEYSSSERQQRTGITKAGSPAFRRVIVQAAWSARRTRPGDPMVQWAIEVEKRRGKKVAIVALARKITGILFAIWRDGTRYEAVRGAAPTL